MQIAVGSDDAGIELKAVIVNHLKERGVDAHDFGVEQSTATQYDYPDVARVVAEELAAGRAERGILICGIGIGMAISANKVPGSRAAQAHDTYSAERARKSNNAQVITLGARVIGSELAKSIVDAWLVADFAGAASTRKVEKIDRIDEDYRAPHEQPR